MRCGTSGTLCRDCDSDCAKCWRWTGVYGALECACRYHCRRICFPRYDSKVLRACSCNVEVVRASFLWPAPMRCAFMCSQCVPCFLAVFRSVDLCWNDFSGTVPASLLSRTFMYAGFRLLSASFVWARAHCVLVSGVAHPRPHLPSHNASRLLQYSVRLQNTPRQH